MLTPAECGRAGLPLSNMSSSDYGKSSGTATGEVPFNSLVTINNSADLSSSIVGQNGAYYMSRRLPIKRTLGPPATQSSMSLGKVRVGLTS
jgi:hypothetical protein